MSRFGVRFSMTIALVVSALLQQLPLAVHGKDSTKNRSQIRRVLLAQADTSDTGISSQDSEVPECPRRQVDIEAEAAMRRKPRSALSLREKKPMPPQLLDFTKYDDVIELDCEEKPNYLKFADTRLAKVVKVRVSCRLDTRNNHYSPEYKYQDLWFNQGLPIGCKHFSKFPIKEKHEIGIFLKASNRTMGDAEIAACASALVQLRLQSTLNGNLITTVRIPSYIFERLKLELAKQRFVSYRENSLSITTLIPIPLETDLGGRETMCFLSAR